MADKYRVVSGTHRRTDDEGNPVVFEQGDVFEPTEEELDAFGDVLEEVKSEGDDWVPVRGGTAAERGFEEGGEYRLVHGSHRRTDDEGNAVVHEEGDVVELSADEVQAFGDKFEPVDAGGDEDTAEPSDGPDEADGESETEADTEVEADADQEPEGEAEGPPEIPPRETLESDEWTYPEIKSLASDHGIGDPDVSQTELLDYLDEQREG